MDTTIFKDIVLNIILVIFPILLYLVFAIYKDDISKKYNDLLLNIALITSLYLCLRFGEITSNNKILLFCNIPIALSLIKAKSKLAIILSLINVLYCLQISNELFAIMLIKYLAYFVLYAFSKKKNISVNSFLLSTAVLQGFFLSFEYFFLETLATINDVIILLLLVFIYYFITFFIVYVFRLIDRIQNLNTTIKILEKDKKISEGLFKLTHEIKNPLSVCKGYLEIIDISNVKKAEKYIKIMKEEVDRSLSIMTDFIQMNRITINKKEISVSYLLEDIYSCFNIIMKTNNIELIYKKGKDIKIRADYDRLKQVLINILKNSVEAINKNGKIEIVSKINKQYLEIIVKDNGVGMDKETLSKLKDMFYTTKENGTGLGVALSNEIIKAHNGFLTYTSTPNNGTTAIIRLPLE